MNFILNQLLLELQQDPIRLIYHLNQHSRTLALTSNHSPTWLPKLSPRPLYFDLHQEKIVSAHGMGLEDEDQDDYGVHPDVNLRVEEAENHRLEAHQQEEEEEMKDHQEEDHQEEEEEEMEDHQEETHQEEKETMTMQIHPNEINPSSR